MHTKLRYLVLFMEFQFSALGTICPGLSSMVQL